MLLVAAGVLEVLAVAAFFKMSYGHTEPFLEALLLLLGVLLACVIAFYTAGAAGRMRQQSYWPLYLLGAAGILIAVLTFLFGAMLLART